jgi:hypothetical protein
LINNEQVEMFSKLFINASKGKGQIFTTHEGELNMSDKDQLEKLNKYQVVIDNLTEVINAYEGKASVYGTQGQAMDEYSALANFVHIASEARDLKTTYAEETKPMTIPDKPNWTYLEM